MLKYFRSAIFRKVLLVLLITALFPAVILGWMAVSSGLQAGDTSTALSREALVEKSQEALELRAVETASAIADFLGEREADLHALALIEPNRDDYLAFSAAHHGELWGILEKVEFREEVPLYRELAFIDPNGQEVVKISAGEAADAGDLHNVLEPGGSLYPHESYFSEALALGEGEVYTGRVTA